MPILLPRRSIPADGGTGTNPQTTAGLMALAPPGRIYSKSPFLPYTGTGWKNGQTFEYSIFVNPSNSAQLLMYYTGNALGGVGGGIGLATAAVSDPLDWTDYGSNPVCTPSGVGVRNCTALYDPTNNVIRLYASGDDATILLYTSTNGTTFTAYNGGSPVFQASQCLRSGCTAVSNSAILRADATHWYMYYCHRGSYGILPSIRIATSSDGNTWTDSGESGWAATASTYYSEYLEGMNQIIAMPDGNYILIASCMTTGGAWSCGWASASSPLGPFTPAASPMFLGNPQAGWFDSLLAVNPSVFNLNGEWLLFYSGGNGSPSNYAENHYSTALARF